MSGRRGFSLLELLVVLAIVGVVVGLVLAAVQRIRVSAAKVQCANNLKQIGLALQLHHDRYSVYPPGVRTEGDPYPFMTWQARLLPGLEQQSLWELSQREFARDARFWAPPRHTPSSMAMPVFVCPLDGRLKATVREGYEVAFTHYLGVSGSAQHPDDGVLPLNATVRIAEIRDGTSQTIAAGERPPSSDSRWGWWYAGVGQDNTGSADMILSAVTSRTTFRTPMCMPGPYHYGPGELANICDIFHFWSLHPGGAHFIFADGSVRHVGYQIGDGLRALASRSGGDGPVAID